MSTRLVGLGGLLAFVTFNVGWIAGDLAQPAAFSPWKSMRKTGAGLSRTLGRRLSPRAMSSK